MDKREAEIHHEYNREKFNVIIEHLERINGRLQQAEKDIATHKSVGITISAMVGFVLTYLGIKE